MPRILALCICTFVFSFNSLFGQPPAAPGLLTGKILAENIFELSWVDNSNNEDSFIVERSTVSYGDFKTVRVLAPNATAFTDTLSIDEYEYEYHFYYRVYAVNEQGNSSYSNILFVNRGSYYNYCVPPETFIPEHGIGRVELGSIGQVNNDCTPGYFSYLHKSTNLFAGQTTHLKIELSCVTNNSSVAVYIDWNGDGDFSGNGEAVYWNNQLRNGTNVEIPIHVPDWVTAGSIMRMRIRSAYELMWLTPCNESTATHDYTINIIESPGSFGPDSLIVAGHTATSMKLGWNDNAGDESGYKVMRSSDSMNFSIIANLPANTIDYIDTGLLPKTKYFYQVGVLLSNVSDSTDITGNYTLPVDFTRQFNGQLTTDYGQNIGGGFWGDFDNDGKYDIYTTGAFEISLFKNENDVYNKIDAGFNASQYAGWADLDNDGDQDLLVCNDNYYTSVPILYENNGDGSFKKSVFSESTALIANCAWTDYNKDGFPDLYIAYESAAGKLFRNNGDKTFTLATQFDNAIGFASFADFDGDGDDDLFVEGKAFRLQDTTFIRDNTANLNNTTTMKFASWVDINDDGHIDISFPHALYINNGQGGFAVQPIDAPPYPRNCSSADFDNDGDQDLFIPGAWGRGPCHLLVNNDGRFDAVPQSAFLNNEWEWDGYNTYSSLADYNNDGFVDVFVGMDNTSGSRLYKNNGNQNRWINMLLQGSTSNKNAIGARVKAKANGKWQYRWIQSNANSPSVEFGFGNATLIDSLEIDWPLGYKQVIVNIQTNQFLTITEPESCIWKGSINNDWEEARNWSCNKIPGTETNVVIPSGASVFISSNVTIKSLQLKPTAAVKVNAGYTVTILE